MILSLPLLKIFNLTVYHHLRFSISNRQTFTNARHIQKEKTKMVVYIRGVFKKSHAQRHFLNFTIEKVLGDTKKIQRYAKALENCFSFHFARKRERVCERVREKEKSQSFPYRFSPCFFFYRNTNYSYKPDETSSFVLSFSLSFLFN